MSQAAQMTAAVLLEDLHQFVTHLGTNNVDVWETPLDEVEATATVRWEADLDIEAWGINGITFNVTAVHVDLVTRIWTDDRDTEGDAEIDWPVKGSTISDDPKEVALSFAAWKLKVSIQPPGEHSYHSIPAIAPNSVSINYRRRIIEVEF